MKNKLYNLLNNDRETVLFVGIGNRLKSDDAVGIYICEHIKSTKNRQSLIVESGIEKYIGKINSLSPEILLLTDCTDFDKEAGYADLLPINKIEDNTFNTHTISLKRVSDFFKMKTYILGIQPEFVGFGEGLSLPVQQSADSIITLINGINN